MLDVGCAPRDRLRYDLRATPAVTDPQFPRIMGNLLGPPLIGGNRVEPLNNGAEIFPAMLSAIASARKTVNFETYIYWSGDIGQKFVEALCERAKAGVKVNVIIDWLGSGRISRQYIDQMRESGVELVHYHPLQWYDIGSAARLNNRTHRKLLIVDGKIGFTGGVGIADVWEGNAQDPRHWRDMHYRIEGPVVAQLQAVFMDNWMKTTGHVPTGEETFPDLAAAGHMFAQVFKSGAQGGNDSMELMFLISIYSARKSIQIGNAYFVPDEQTIAAMLEARRRGVRIQIIVPGRHTDSQIVGNASRDEWGQLLKAGVEILEYQPTMYHTKLLIVDALWVSVGSCNLDDRSLHLNDEANLNVYDPTFAATQIRTFEQDIEKSQPITYGQWNDRTLLDKILGGLAHLFAPLI